MQAGRRPAARAPGYAPAIVRPAFDQDRRQLPVACGADSSGRHEVPAASGPRTRAARGGPTGASEGTHPGQARPGPSNPTTNSKPPAHPCTKDALPATRSKSVFFWALASAAWPAPFMCQPECQLPMAPTPAQAPSPLRAITTAFFCVMPHPSRAIHVFVGSLLSPFTMAAQQQGRVVAHAPLLAPDFFASCIVPCNRGSVVPRHAGLHARAQGTVAKEQEGSGAGIIIILLGGITISAALGSQAHRRCCSPRLGCSRRRRMGQTAAALLAIAATRLGCAALPPAAARRRCRCRLLPLPVAPPCCPQRRRKSPAWRSSAQARHQEHSKISRVVLIRRRGAAAVDTASRARASAWWRNAGRRAREWHVRSAGRAAVPATGLRATQSLACRDWGAGHHLQRADGALLPPQRQPCGAARRGAVPGCEGARTVWRAW